MHGRRYRRCNGQMLPSEGNRPNLSDADSMKPKKPNTSSMKLFLPTLLVLCVVSIGCVIMDGQNGKLSTFSEFQRMVEGSVARNATVVDAIAELSSPSVSCGVISRGTLKTIPGSELCFGFKTASTSSDTYLYCQRKYGERLMTALCPLSENSTPSNIYFSIVSEEKRIESWEKALPGSDPASRFQPKPTGAKETNEGND